MKEKLNDLQEIAVEVRRRYPRLTQFECLELACKIQQNEMLRVALEGLKKKIW